MHSLSWPFAVRTTLNISQKIRTKIIIDEFNEPFVCQIKYQNYLFVPIGHWILAMVAHISICCVQWQYDFDIYDWRTRIQKPYLLHIGSSSKSCRMQ